MQVPLQVTWRSRGSPAGAAAQAGESLPAGKVWATRAGLSCPLDCGRILHTLSPSHTLSPPRTLSPPHAGTRRQHSSCFSLQPIGLSQVPGKHKALWDVTLGWHCQECFASCHTTPWRATAAVLASPKGA